MSPYTLCKNALLACNYAEESARRIARRLTRRKGDWVKHFNEYVSS